MDTSNGRPNEGASGAIADVTMEVGDWRAPLQRERIVNKIMDTLKTNLPFSRHDRLQELKKIAKRVEEEIYTAATSQSEYSRKICLHMLTMETRLLNPMSGSMHRKSAAISVNPSVPFDSTANGRDWQNEVYQKIKVLQELYLLEYKLTEGASGAFGDPTMNSSDWRAQLQADSRQRIVHKILGTLKSCFPDFTHEELQDIAVRFEEIIYTVATSQSDYLRMISLKMLTMENRSQETNALNLSDPGSQVMQRVNNQVQQHPIPVPSNNIQQMMSLSIHSNVDTSSFSPALPPGCSSQQPTMTNVAGQSVNMQNGAVGDPTMDSGDWRAQLRADSRERIMNKIMWIP